MKYSPLLIALALSAAEVRASSWTNAAGHSIEAVLIGRKGNTLTLKRPNGHTFTMPVAALSEGSRRQVDAECPPVPKPTHEAIVARRTEARLQQLKEKRERKRSSGKIADSNGADD